MGAVLSTAAIVGITLTALVITAVAVTLGVVLTKKSAETLPPPEPFDIYFNAIISNAGEFLHANTDASTGLTETLTAGVVQNNSNIAQDMTGLFYKNDTGYDLTISSVTYMIPSSTGTDTVPFYIVTNGWHYTRIRYTHEEGVPETTESLADLNLVLGPDMYLFVLTSEAQEPSLGTDTFPGDCRLRLKLEYNPAIPFDPEIIFDVVETPDASGFSESPCDLGYYRYNGQIAFIPDNGPDLLFSEAEPYTTWNTVSTAVNWSIGVNKIDMRAESSPGNNECRVYQAGNHALVTNDGVSGGSTANPNSVFVDGCVTVHDDIAGDVCVAWDAIGYSVCCMQTTMLDVTTLPLLDIEGGLSSWGTITDIYKVWPISNDSGSFWLFVSSNGSGGYFWYYIKRNKGTVNTPDFTGDASLGTLQVVQFNELLALASFASFNVEPAEVAVGATSTGRIVGMCINDGGTGLSVIYSDDNMTTWTQTTVMTGFSFSKLVIKYIPLTKSFWVTDFFDEDSGDFIIKTLECKDGETMSAKTSGDLAINAPYCADQVGYGFFDYNLSSTRPAANFWPPMIRTELLLRANLQ